MHRNSHNLRIYRNVTCTAVMKRADNRCEVIVDRAGRAATTVRTERQTRRCGTYIPLESVTWTNFLHTESRNGKPKEWVLDANSIVFGCAQHHYEEEATGKRVIRCEYEEITYIPEI